MLGVDSPGKGAEIGIQFQGGKAANIGEQVGLRQGAMSHIRERLLEISKSDEIQRGFRVCAASLLTMHSKLKTFRPAHSPPAHIEALSATYSVKGAWLHR